MRSLESSQCSRGTPPLVLPTLRPYQQRFIADIYTHIRLGSKRILGVSATGSGKTIMIAQIISDAVSRGRRVLINFYRHF